MNFYLILGVPAEASTADIKRAYRRLARRYHPGVNPGDRAAEEMFQRVVEAYETLVDPGRRRQYDSAGSAGIGPRAETSSFMFAEFDFSAARRGAQASTFTELFAEVLHPVPGSGPARAELGADLHAALTVSFAESVHGVERQVLVTRQVVCGGCAGRGEVAVPEAPCRPCQGTGQVRWARGHMVFSKPCAACAGEGRQTRERCPICSGQGRTVRGEAVGVVVAPGITDGAHLRVMEMGHAGRHGGRTGDLYVTVHVQPHPWFRREGDDLVCTLPVAVHEAALGARIDVPSLEGPIKLRVPAGTQAGARLRASGRGLVTAVGAAEARGDLVFEVTLTLPAALDERSRELMREFAERNRDDVRRARFGTLDASATPGA
jgi:molecular chaperone DnaJ